MVAVNVEGASRKDSSDCKDKMSIREKQRMIGRCVNLLHKKYGNKEKPTSRQIIEQVIFYHLHRAVNITSARNVLRNLRSSYIDYNEVRITKQQDLSRMLAQNGVPVEKSFLIKGFLRSIFDKESRLCLEHLKELDRERFYERMSRIEGVDNAVIDYVRLCTFNEPILPLSEDVRRVLERYGVSVENMSGQDAGGYHNYCKKVDFYQAFCLFVEHSQKVCLVDNPRCDKCVLAKTCSTAIKKRMEVRRKKTEEKK